MKSLKSTRVFCLIAILICLPLSSTAFGDETDALVVDETGNVSIQNSLSVGGAVSAGSVSTTGNIDATGNMEAQRVLVKSNDVSTTSDISLTNNSMIETDGSMYFSIDSDNNETSKAFLFGHNAEGTTGWGELIRINENGRVGIGTTNPQSLLHIATTNDAWGGGLTLQNIEQGAKVYMRTGWYTLDFLDISISNSGVLTIFENGNAYFTGTVFQNSDVILKEDIVELDSSLDKITKIRGVSYKWKDKEIRGDKKHIGLIAQEVEAVYPELVSSDQNGIKSVAYGNLVAPVIEAVKELKVKNETLQAENDAFKKEIKDMKKELKMLKEQLLALMVTNDDKELAQK